MFARAMTVALWLMTTSGAFAGQNIVVLLDDSGSMGDRMRNDWGTRKINAAREALLTVLEKLPPDARIGVLALNGGGADHWVVPLGRVDRSRLQSSIKVIRASGGTPLGASMKVAADALLNLREKSRYGTYKLLIVTDGEANDQERVDGYLPDILSRGITVDVIGVDMRQDHSLATRVQTYRRADDPASLRQAISQVVLGESTADARDAGESDFEMLAGFPDEVAVAALDALARQGNAPIRTKSAAAASQVAERRTVTIPLPPAGHRDASSWRGLIGFFTGCCGIACLAGFAVVVMFVIAAGKRKR
ncbi:MAG: VWA domain-containing protein [Pirellulaceae bacterium]